MTPISEMDEIISDEEIEEAFKGSNFGGCDPRKLLEQGVLKRLTGYGTGWTLAQIMCGLGLTTKKRGAVTKKGKRFAMGAFYEIKHSG